jgi:hypothetical protein
MTEIVMGLIIASACIALARLIIKKSRQILLRLKRQPAAIGKLFNDHYVDSRSVYLYYTGKIPSVALIKGIDVNAAIEMVRNKFKGEFAEVLQNSAWRFQHNELRFSTTLYLINNGMMIEFGYDYAELLYEAKLSGVAKELSALMASYQVKECIEQDEVNISEEQLAMFMSERLN